MVERRSAGEALSLTPPVEEFIARGVPNGEPGSVSSADQESVDPPKGKTKRIHRPKSPDSSSRRPRSAGKRKHKKTPKPETETVTEALLQTYAKATVQKTVRFQPKLIAEFEELTRTQQLSGEKPKSFQDAQNEALALWLKGESRSDDVD